MKQIEVLQWLANDFPLRRLYTTTGNYWCIGGEKCTRAAETLLRKHHVREFPRDVATMTNKGRDALAIHRRHEHAREQRNGLHA